MPETCSLECILNPEELLFSGAMAPLSFKPLASSDGLRSASLLDYASGLLRKYGILSFSIKPAAVASGMIDVAKQRLLR